MRLAGKVAVVTGAGGGIGRAIAAELAREGAHIVAADIALDEAKATADTVRTLPGKASAVWVDVASYESVESLVQHAVELHGSLGIMVNNAGISTRGLSILDLPLDQYHHVVDVNQHGVFYGMKAAARAMKGNGGVILNTGSIYGHIVDHRGHPNYTRFPYHASKGAVAMMTKAAALELAPHGIRVVEVAPGLIETELVNAWKESTELWNSLRSAHMRGQAGTPTDVGKVVAFLASEDAEFVNGHSFFVDDGAASFKG